MITIGKISVSEILNTLNTFETRMQNAVHEIRHGHKAAAKL
jgi:hypothetical protein